MNRFLFMLLGIYGSFMVSAAEAMEKTLGHNETINVESAKQIFKKVSCGKGEVPACVVLASSGGFQLMVSEKNKFHTSNFLKLARRVKALQRQGTCGQLKVSTIKNKQKVLNLVSGQHLLLDYSNGIETVNCESDISEKVLEKCYLMTHPISAASLFYNDMRLDTSSALIRDDYKSLEVKYSKILTEIGLCSL